MVECLKNDVKVKTADRMKLKKAMNKLENIAIDQAQMTKLFSFMDKDKDGIVDKIEFVLILTMHFQNIEISEMQQKLLVNMTYNINIMLITIIFIG